MKHYRMLILTIFLSVGSFFNVLSIQNYYDQPSDYLIVNQIHRKSYLTQTDVDKVKLVMLGQFQSVAAAGAGAYVAYKGGSGAYQLLDMLGTYGPSESKTMNFKKLIKSLILLHKLF